MTDLRPETDAAIAAVRTALQTAKRPVGVVSMKGARDIVTETDVAIEDDLRSALGGVATVVGEERGGDETAAQRWVVDPLCGTRNFANGIPLYCVNVALVEDGQVTVAVVGDASTGDVLVAERGRGAFRLDGMEPLQATRASGAIVIETGKSTGDRRERAARFLAAAALADEWDLMALNSTLSTAYVAAGRVAAYVQFFATTVHNAAGSLLAEEAGVTVTDIDGAPWTVESDSLLAAADPELHAELLSSESPGKLPRTDASR